MAYLNKLMVIGRLTRDPELRYVAEGSKAVTKFAVAINRKVNGADDVLFLDVVAWEKLGETCNTYLKKGMNVFVEGRLAIRKYDDKDGVQRTAVELVATGMQMLDRKDDSARPAAAPAPQAAPATRSAAPAHDAWPDDVDDTIPF